MIIDFYLKQNGGGGGSDPAVLAGLNAHIGNPAPYSTPSAALAALQYPQVLEPGATTVRKSADATDNVASNDLLKIWGSDDKLYTVAQWNALFVAAGYDHTAMTVTPKGYAWTQRDGSVVKMTWENFQGQLAKLDGSALDTAASLPHSPYSTMMAITAADSGTDAINGGAWSIVADDETDEWVLTAGQTGQTFRVPKGFPYTNAGDDDKTFAEWTEICWTLTEWYRHRFAIDSGLTTTEADGTIEEVEILNASGEQAAAGEDMYFWIGGVNSEILAKYNANNVHKGNATSCLTDTLRNTLYASQKANGINMNDTGVNSASKPVLAPGAKGAEAIAVSGKWFIITPFVTYPTNANQFGDCPAVAYVRSKGMVLPPLSALDMVYWNKTLLNALRTYLVSTEGWTLDPVPASATIWAAPRQSTNHAWYVNTSYGTRYLNNTVTRYRVVGASGL